VAKKKKNKRKKTIVREQGGQGDKKENDHLKGPTGRRDKKKIIQIIRGARGGKMSEGVPEMQGGGAKIGKTGM